MTSIARDAFAGCTALTDVYYAGTPTDRGSITFGTGNGALTDATWHYTGDFDGDGEYTNTDSPRCSATLPGGRTR